HPASTEIYTLSLHDALPISGSRPDRADNAEGHEFAAVWSNHLAEHGFDQTHALVGHKARCKTQSLVKKIGYWEVRNGCCKDNQQDRKSTRLNSSHSQISYAV